MASRLHHRSRHNRVPSGSSTATAATAASNASTTIAQGPNGDPGATLNGNTTSTSSHPNAPSTVRRNLFPQHLSRRVASGSSTSSGAGPSSASVPPRNSRAHNSAPPVAGDGVAASAPTREPSGTSSSASVSQSLPTSAVSTSSAPVDVDIVARDKNGCYKVDVPALPSGAPGEEVDEEDSNPMEGVEGVEAGVNAGAGEVGPEGGITGTAQESMALLKLDESINDMMRRHRSRQIHGEPSEVFLLIQQSLRNKVASLDDDKWMYEVEDEIRI